MALDTSDINQIKQLLNAQREEIRQDMVRTVNEGIDMVVVPALDKIHADLKSDIAALRDEHGTRFDRIEAKLDATVALTDRHDKQIRRLEREAGLPPLAASPR